MLHSFGDIWFNGRVRRQKIHERRVFFFVCLFGNDEDDGGQKKGWLEFYFHTHKNPSSPIGGENVCYMKFIILLIVITVFSIFSLHDKSIIVNLFKSHFFIIFTSPSSLPNTHERKLKY